MKQVVIGLMGAKGSGKSTFADIAHQRYPVVNVFALADKLKLACAEELGLPIQAFTDPGSKERLMLHGSRELTHDAVAALLDQFGIVPTDENVVRHVGKRLYTYRQVAQYVGTEILRSQDPDIHCKGLMLALPKENVSFMVTDIRFLNELKFFRKTFPSAFYAFYIKRDSADIAAAKDKHASEQQLPLLAAEANFTVFNDGTLPQFVDKVVSAVAGILCL